MPLFFHKKPPRLPQRQQPRPDLPWTLTQNGVDSAAFTWGDIVHGLDALTTDPDSFLILRQSGADGWYWFLQSALLPMGPHAGQYIVEAGYRTDQGPVLLDRYAPTAREVIPLFADAYQRGALDLSEFEDCSGQLPVNS